MTATGKATLSVLLVEDSIPVRHRLAALFCESPLVRIVGEAGSIDEALFLLRINKPGAVVVDVELPDGSGLQLIRFLREKVPTCHIIVLTSYDLPELRHYCAQLGVMDFFNKATEFDVAATRLHEIAAHKTEERNAPPGIDISPSSDTTSASSGH